jgi:hypothetical protein
VRGDQRRCLESYRPSTGPEVEDVLAWRQSSAPDDLLDHGDEALISLTLIELWIAIPYPALPRYSFTIAIGWWAHATSPCYQGRDI